MTFAGELQALLPNDLPNRDAVLIAAADHLDRITETNRQFNLTRIVEPREAAIKHVLDSVLPWRLFAGAKTVSDAGSGAGFPGIPLALTLPGIHFTLLESTQKKARFIQSVVSDLKLPNVTVVPERAEDWLKTNSPDILTARAVAPLDKALALFGPYLRRGGRLLLYKGSDAEAEIAAAANIAQRNGWKMRVVERYELPDGAGIRTMIQVN